MSTCSSPHACYMSCPFKLPWFDHPNTCQKVQITELLILQFSLVICHFIPLRSKCCPKHFLLNTLNLCSLPNVTERIHTHSKQKVNMQLYIFQSLFSTYIYTKILSCSLVMEHENI
jgi:hypothetical protein